MTAPAQPRSDPQGADKAGTVIGALAHFAAHAPQRPAYIDHQATLSYAELYTSARRGAAWLMQQGVRPGDTVALPLDPSPPNARRALEFVYAIAHAGAVLLPLFPEVPLAARIELIGRFGAHWLLASGALPPTVSTRALDPRGFDPADNRLDAPAPARADRADGAFAYLFTSGTTGAAKVLLSTHAQLHDSARASARFLGIEADDRLLAPIPWPSTVSIRYLALAHAAGAAFVSAPLGDTRARLRDLLARFAVTRISASPWQVRRLLLSPAAGQPLPPLRSLRVIGAFISGEEIEAARANLTPNTYVGYGFNEIGVVTLLRPGQAGPAGFVGGLMPGVEARADGALGRPLPPEHVGDLGFRSPWMCTGYADNPAATRERFRDGWFYPGDAGSIDAAGNVTLRGRTQEVINYGGLKIWPEDIESVLKLHPDVLDAAVVGLPDPLAGEVPAAFLVPRVPLGGPLPEQLSQAALQSFCSARIDASRVPQVFVAVHEIPRNEAGKILRDALIAAYLRAGEAAGGASGSGST